MRRKGKGGVLSQRAEADKKMPPWRRGYHGGAFKIMRQPGEGDEAAANIRYRRGTGLTPDSAEADDL
ncbi:hypothetical protein DY251_00390 [Mesorhizobium denitrificans]|uniref:Uncharacterized protein n=1 Tax=Mesorhizobium denitrificans TaxID=2294114 RepID=A0A371XJ64_9HYPH|nr:hypothetical protein DY251_00390 [Mesorhizobium denitrificans]